MIKKAKAMDLLTYLKSYEPSELVRITANTYSTKTHDSLKISNGKWMWWSKGVGGRSAVDYLVIVRNMTFLEAVKTICEKAPIPYSKTAKEAKTKTNAKVRLPPKADDNDVVISYLKGRGISENIIDYFISDGSIYQSSMMNNLVFVGFDDSHKPKYAGIRGTGKSRFKGDVYGSDKNYTFRLVKSDSDIVHVFEGAIDLMSFATLLEMQGEDFKDYNLITLAGVYKTSQYKDSEKLPISFDTYLKTNRKIKTVYLHFDNDAAGRNAAASFYRLLKDRYEVVNDPVPYGKDVNDYLCMQSGIPVKKSDFIRRNESR